MTFPSSFLLLEESSQSDCIGTVKMYSLFKNKAYEFSSADLKNDLTGEKILRLSYSITFAV